MKKFASIWIVALLCLNLSLAQTNSLAIKSATITTTAVGSGQNEVVVRVEVPSIANAKLVYLTFEDASTNAALYTNSYDVPSVAVLNLSNTNPVLELRFFTDIELSGARLKLQLEDPQANKGAEYSTINN